MIPVNIIVDIKNVTIIISWHNVDTSQNWAYFVEPVNAKIQKVFYS